MNLLLDGIAWILDPANWTGVGSIPERIGQHLLISAIVLVIASLIALPVGVLVGHTGRGKDLAVTVSGGLGRFRRSACSPCSRCGSASD